MAIYSCWDQVPELMDGGFLAINVANEKPESLDRNKRYKDYKKAGDWPISSANVKRGLVGKKIVLHYGPRPTRTLYLGNISKAQRSTQAGNGQWRYVFSITDRWQIIGQTKIAFRSFFSSEESIIGSGSVTHWVDERASSAAIATSSRLGDEVPCDGVRRVGQIEFARDVSAYWGDRCALTGVSVQELLEACHIVPWAALDNDHPSRVNPNNGLLLCAHLHKLFDAYFLSFADEGELLIRRDLDPTLRQLLLATGARRLRHRPNTDQIAYLRSHRASGEEKGFEWEAIP